MDFGKEIETSNVGLGNNKIGGCGGVIIRDHEIRNSLEYDGVVFFCGVMGKG